MNRESDLLGWQEPARAATADLIPFPAKRRVGKTRRVAAVLLSKGSDRARSAYWRQVEIAMADTMRRVGIADGEIDRQLSAFSEAVSVEMKRQMHRGSREHA